MPITPLPPPHSAVYELVAGSLEKRIASDEPMELPIVIVNDADTVIEIVDGNHRSAACHELGYECPVWAVPASALAPCVVLRSDVPAATLAQLGD